MKVECKGRTNYTRFDNMETEILEAILQADFDAPEAEQMDEEAILYILNILERRREGDHSLTQLDVQAAKERFYQEYYPLLEHEDLLLDFYGDPDEIDAASQKSKLAVGRAFLLQKLKKLPKTLRRIVVAAAIVIVLFTGSDTVHAFGVELFANIAQWGDGVFWFIKAPVTAELRDEMRQYFKLEEIDAVLPKWLPAGYEFYNVKIEETETNKLEVWAAYSKNKNIEALVICYIYSDDNSKTLYEMDNVDSTAYIVNGIKHCIVPNVGYKTISWQNNNFECYIVGDFSIEEAKKIVDSIYEE